MRAIRTARFRTSRDVDIDKLTVKTKSAKLLRSSDGSSSFSLHPPSLQLPKDYKMANYPERYIPGGKLQYFRTLDMRTAQMNDIAGEDDPDASSNVAGGSAAKIDHDRTRTTDYELAEYGYGKNHVKLLKVEREGALHHIREYEVSTHLKLDSSQDFLQGDNKKIIATDTQKNTVYLLARKYGIKSPEDFALQLCSHFLYLYPQVTQVSVHIEEYPWQRLLRGREMHNHAFVFAPVCYRSCIVTQARNEGAHIQGRIHGLRLLKTTQSSFTDFVQDEYRTLPDQNDRIFSTIVRAEWIYNTVRNVDFDHVWRTVKECIIEQFAGDPKTGIFSPSVQNTLYLAAKSVLDKVEEIQTIKMEMPNKHYNSLDLSKFANLIKGGSDDHEVYQPVDKPAGYIHAELERGRNYAEHLSSSKKQYKSKL